MPSQSTVLTRKQCAAIEALLESPSISDAAHSVDMPVKTLYRWLENPLFDAEYRAATRARFLHQMARSRQAAKKAAWEAFSIMLRGQKQSDRYRAARLLRQWAEEAQAIDDFDVSVTRLERGQPPASLSPDAPGKPPLTGHGAKFPRKQQQAIAALLEERTLTAAAHVTKLSVQTLCRWLNEPVFAAQFAAAARTVWRDTIQFLRSQLPHVITVLQSSVSNPAMADSIRLQAIRDTARETKAAQLAGLENRVAKLESAAGAEPPAQRSKTIPQSLYRPVRRFQAHLGQARTLGSLPLAFMHAIDGRPAGTSVRGPDGRLVWLDPPPGCKAGELAKEEA